MRGFPIVLVSVVVACGKSDEAKPPPAPAANTEAAPKRPVPTQALPPLASDPGGASGKPMWSAAFGGTAIDAPKGIALGADNSVYVAGYFEGEIDFGGSIGKVKPAGKSDAFLTKLSADGKLQWVRSFGAAREDSANGVAVRGDSIVVVGSFDDQLDLGEYHHKAAGSDDAFVASFDPKGNVQWLWTFGGIDSDGANAVAPTPDGGWVIGGSYTAAIDDDATRIHVKSKGHTDAILIKLKASGDVEWVKSFGGRYDDTILHVACDANGNIYIQGHFKDIADFGGKPLKAAGGSDNDIVLAKYDTNGDPVWAQRFGNAFNDVAGGLAVDRAGNITMVGSFDHSISFGEGDDHQSLGEADAYVARFSTDGKLQWARTFGAEREDVAWGVAADEAGNTVTTGWFQDAKDAVDFGKGGAIRSKGNKDVFVLKLDPKGAPLWVQTWGDHDHDQGRGVALDDKGNPVVTGIFRFKLDVVEPVLESKRDEKDPVLAKAPPPDAFVVKLQR